MFTSGLCSISFRNLTPIEIIDICDKANIRNIEWGSDVHVPGGDFIAAKKIKELCDKKHISCPSYGTYFKCESEDGFLDLCKTAIILGAKTLRVWAGTKSSNLYSLEEYDAFIKLISKLANIAKEYGLVIGFENHKLTLTDTIDSILRLHNDLPFDNVKFYFQPDYWNEYRNDECRINSNLFTLSKIESFLINIHVYQWYIRTNAREPLNYGHYEWLEYFKLVNVDATCYLEFLKDDSVDQFYEDAKELNELIRKVNALPKLNKYPFKEKDIYEILKNNLTDVDLLNNKVKESWKNSSILKELNKTLFDRANEELLKESPKNYKSEWETFESSGERYNFEVPYNARRNRLKLFAYAYYLSNKDIYLNKAIEEIDNILNEYSWTIPAHFKVAFLNADDVKKHQRGIDLTSAVTGATLAEVYYILKDVLKESTKTAIKETVKEYLFDNIDKPYWWAINDPTNNWASVCGGCVGVAAIYLLDDPKELARILTFSLNTCSHYIDGFLDDGCCVEGASYWNYGFGMYICFADLLYRLSNKRINLFTNPKIHNISRYINAISITKDKAISFSDSIESNVYLYGFVCRLNEIYPDIEPNINLFDSTAIDNPTLFTTEHEMIALRELIWAKEICSNCSSRGKTYIFKDTGWFITSSNDKRVALAFKGGHNFEPHNHLDVGSFELFKNDKAIISDLGKGVYTKDYFDNEVRYKNIFCCSSKSHSVPNIDNIEQAFGIENRSEDFVADDNSVSLELKKAYGIVEDITSFKRSLRFNKDSGNIELKDSFIFRSKTHEIKERFIFVVEPIIKGNEIIIVNNGERYSLISESLFNSYHVEKVIDIDANNQNRTSYVLELNYLFNESIFSILIRGKNA